MTTKKTPDEVEATPEEITPEPVVTPPAPGPAPQSPGPQPDDAPVRLVPSKNKRGTINARVGRD